MAQQPSGGLRAFEHALASGDMGRVEAALGALSDEERAALEQLIGRDALTRMTRSVRAVRGPRAGRVIVIHGIMGSLLDSVRAGDSDRVWINVLRLMDGRMGDLRLDEVERPTIPGLQVVTAGLHSTYAPLIVDLSRRWHVKPFAFDWRLSIEKSADRLAQEISAWANGEPVHLVVHSMGGLVSRCMIARHPAVWKAMAGQGLESGGRLIMLGTPNLGSFAVPMVLTGKESLVKWLARLDLHRDLSGLLGVLGTFPGLYQMLPSPAVDLADDHEQLYQRSSWGSAPVVQRLLDRSAEFHTSIEHVIDPERMIYIAGYDQETVSRIRIDEPGSFSYRITSDGDGRVPHSLGLLKDVATYWVDEEHAALPKNDVVLEALDDLLLTGKTANLPSVCPRRRKAEGEIWLSPEEIEPSDVTMELMLERRRSIKPTEAEAAQIEARMVARWLPSSGGSKVATSKSAAQDPPSLRVEVVWGEITKADGDVYAVGHYRGVLPQYAERALDAVVSQRDNIEEHVIRLQTRRGVLRGDVGEVYLFPWADGSAKLVAVAGMGYAGTFGRAELRILAKALTWKIAPLPRVSTVCTVLIGGKMLSVQAAVDGLFDGITDALSEGPPSKVHTLRIVERDRDRAVEIQRAITRTRSRVDLRARLKLEIAGTIAQVEGREVRPEHALSLVLASIAKRPPEQWQIAPGTPEEDIFARSMREALEKVGALGESIEQIAEKLSVGIEAAPIEQSEIPARVSFVSVDGQLRTSAITETAAVPERIQAYDRSLLAEIVTQMTDPPHERVAELGTFVGKFLLPMEFRPLLRTDRTVVFEVDRTMGRVPWEMLCTEYGDDMRAEPLALRVPFARQLRTTYSAPPAMSGQSTRALRALVIGDPGDPELGHSLPGALREAEEVVAILQHRGVEVTPMLGAPDRMGRGPIENVPAAARLSVLQHLYRGGWDVVHYCGHGDFDAKAPERAGWLFKGGLLTAQEIAQLKEPPLMIVANACLSAKTSTLGTGGMELDGARGDMDLVPSLADEFLRSGVHNYVGTAWKVDDEGAILFATTLYDTLLSGEGNLGHSLLTARQALYRKRDSYRALWAAYQHFGDPLLRFTPLERPKQTPAANARGKKVEQRYFDLWNREAWDQVEELYAALPHALKRRADILQKRAFALNRRAGPGDREKAEEILTQLIEGSAADQETFGLLGRIYEDRWLAQGGSELLRRAIDTYHRGFDADPMRFYTGINALSLLNLSDDARDRAMLDALLPRVEQSIEQGLTTKPDFWAHAGAVEFAVITKRFDKARDRAQLATAVRPIQRWMIEALLRSLELQMKRLTVEEKAIVNEIVNVFVKILGSAS